ncbi:MarR family winged helix-turn-helix transcriptional regulator [Aliikangiella coralliicola]|uniref:MarR family transcriptional regulator n=1 Tax=Aliikangiella coralliicola TaxID=2592383 RepID=A0A545UAQ4_9GAMM|nr:winged helix DNA-binding protein [Aliikangiella coralliicola]TQV86540.1 MarR family transcriptional regulator [Aliikangiella coralliicola]
MHKYRITRKRKQAFELTEQLEKPLDLYDHLPFQIAVVSNLLQLNRDVAIRDIIELEPRELRTILNIGSYMPIKAADIAYQSRLDSYTVSRAVKTLRSLEMIDSAPNDANKKVKYLVLTEKGKSVYQRLCHEINERTRELESVLEEDEKLTLMELLAKLEDKTESMLAGHAQSKLSNKETITADQREIIRWWKKSNK